MTADGAVTIVQLSDLHLTEDHAELYPGLNPWNHFDRACDVAASFTPDAVVITGDICQRTNDAYDEAAAQIAQLRERLNCPVVVIPGNHDTPERVDDRFHDPHAHVDGSAPTDANWVLELGQLRLIGLDTRGQKHKYGTLSSEQVAWTAERLAELDGTDRGAVLVMHHPPVDGMLESIATIGLSERDELHDLLLTTSRVKLIVSGHFHYAQTSTFAAVPVWVGPAVAYANDVTSPRDTLRGLNASGMSVIRWTPGETGHESLITPVALSATDLGTEPPPPVVLFTKTKKKK